MKKIILDTNFLLIPGEFNVDIIKELERIMDDQYELYIIDQTIDELHNIIEKQKGKEKAAANLALEFIKKNPIKLIKTTPKTEILKNVDEIIEKTVNREQYIVATQDKGLKAKLKEKQIPLIVLRQKNHLRMERG